MSNGNGEWMQALADYDPFCFKKADGRFLMCKTYADAYVELLTRLYEQCRGGYIDIAVFLVDNCSMKYNYALTYIPRFERLGCNYRNDRDWDGVVIVDWNNVEKYESVLECIAKGMHLLLGTDFNSSMWKDGFTRFRIKNKIF